MMNRHTNDTQTPGKKYIKKYKSSASPIWEAYENHETILIP